MTSPIRSQHWRYGAKALPRLFTTPFRRRPDERVCHGVFSSQVRPRETREEAEQDLAEYCRQRGIEEVTDGNGAEVP
jgi:hypothetical protein